MPQPPRLLPPVQELSAPQVQRLKRLAAGLATGSERKAIREEQRAASRRGLYALKNGRARL